MFGSTFSRKPIALILIVSGSIFLMISLASFVYFSHFVRTAANVDGKIIRMIENKDKDGDTLYYPVFVFKDAQDVEHTIHSSWGSFPPAYEIGDNVPILYSPNSPDNAKISSFSSIWGISLITGIIGFLELPSGIVVWLWPNSVERFKKKV